VSTRVIQWATGPVGRVQLTEVIDNPDFELVGVFVYSPDKVGVDAGALVGRPDTGVVATNDRAAIMALDADVVLHSASKAYGFDANTDDIVALLETGKNVITVTSYAHLPTLGSDVDERIHNACAAGNSRFCPAGEHPGFMLEKLAVSLTALCQRVDTTVQQFVDCSHVPEERMLVDLMGMGKRPDEISIESPAFRAVSTQSEQAIGAAADVLGVPIDEIHHVIRTGVSPNDVTLDCTTLRAGTVVGQILSWTAYHADKPVLVVEEFWTCTADIPDWDLVLDGHTVRISVDGVPNISAQICIDADPVARFGNVSGGYVAVGISALRAIPYVFKAPPGVVVPEVFGAYRWPA